MIILKAPPARTWSPRRPSGPADDGMNGPDPDGCPGSILRGVAEIGRIVHSLWPRLTGPGRPCCAGLPERHAVHGVGVDGRISYDQHQQIAALGACPDYRHGKL